MHQQVYAQKILTSKGSKTELKIYNGEFSWYLTIRIDTSFPFQQFLG